MAKHIGRQIKMGIAKESTRGTAATPSHYVKWTSFDHESVPEYANDEGAMGTLVPTTEGHVVAKMAQGGFSANLGDDAIGLILYNLLGGLSSDANADASGNVYDHTYSLAESVTHQSLTITTEEPNQELAFALAMIESFELKFELGKLVEYTANFVSQGEASASITPSFQTENLFRPQDLTVKLASAKSGLGAASAICVRSLTLKIEKNTEADKCLGNVAPQDFNNREFKITGSMELIFENETYKDYNLDGTARALRIDLVNSGVTIGTAANPQLLIDLNSVQFQEYDRSKGLGDMVTQTLGFVGHYSIGDAEAIEAVLTNLTSSY